MINIDTKERQRKTDTKRNKGQNKSTGKQLERQHSKQIESKDRPLRYASILSVTFYISCFSQSKPPPS